VITIEFSLLFILFKELELLCFQPSTIAVQVTTALLTLPVATLALVPTPAHATLAIVATAPAAPPSITALTATIIARPLPRARTPDLELIPALVTQVTMALELLAPVTRFLLLYYSYSYFFFFLSD